MLKERLKEIIESGDSFDWWWLACMAIGRALIILAATGHL